MAQMLVIYRRPPDEAAFRRHYFDVHVPLARRLPNLQRYKTSNGPIVALAGAPDVYFVATLWFATLAELHAAVSSEIGKACAADRLKLAPNDADVQILLFDTAPA